MVAMGPISSALLGTTIDLSQFGVLKYQSLIMFTGLAMALSGLSGLVDVFKTPKDGFLEDPKKNIWR